MDIKGLNEELDKFLMNEISDKTVNSLADKRADNLRDARRNFDAGSGSLSTLKKAKEKNDNAQDLIAKRKARKEANYKHTLEYKLDGELYSLGLSDEDLIRIVNNIDVNRDNNKVCTTIEEAREEIQRRHDVDDWDMWAYFDIIKENGEHRLTIGGGKAQGCDVILDKTPDEINAEKAAEEEKERKKRDKVFKALNTENMAKEVKKSGEIVEFGSYKYDDDLRYTFGYKFKNNTGLSSQDEFDSYLQYYVDAEHYGDYSDYFRDLVIDLSQFASLPETKDLDGTIDIDDEVYDEVWIELVDKKTLIIHCVAGYIMDDKDE